MSEDGDNEDVIANWSREDAAGLYTNLRKEIDTHFHIV